MQMQRFIDLPRISQICMEQIYNLPIIATIGNSSENEIGISLTGSR